MKRNVLVYLQDIGGVHFLLPLINLFTHRNSWPEPVYFIHPIAKTLTSSYINYNIIQHDCYPISYNKWGDLLKEHKINSILCTLSSKKVDMTNSNLLHLASDVGIPTIGFMDHWKGYDRLIGNDGAQIFCPDWLGVMDKHSEKSLSLFGITKPKVRVVGNPMLEMICKESHAKKKMESILLVSQPAVENNTYKSIYENNYDGQRLIDVIADAVTDSGLNFRLHYRPHPKEKELKNLPSGIELDNTNKEKLFEQYDIYIGVDSMLLFEAHLAGKLCISLNNEITGNLNDSCIPYNYAESISNITTLIELLRTHMAWIKKKHHHRWLDDSKNRCAKFLEEFFLKDIK